MKEEFYKNLFDDFELCLDDKNTLSIFNKIKESLFDEYLTHNNYDTIKQKLLNYFIKQ